MVLIKVSIFLTGSLLIVFYSRNCLRDTHSHGFFRFFAFESILALICHNLDRWFQDPFSPRQLVSWSLLLGSILLAIHGFTLLRSRGKPSGHFEATTQMVQQGAYRHIRHPLYSSLLLLSAGAFLKHPSPIAALSTVLAILFLFVTARVEEGENRDHFGQAYSEYMQRTRMFIPHIF